MRTLPPDAIAVEPMDDYRLRVTFDNGEVKEFDAKPLLVRKCYARLTNKAFFALASIQYGCVTWPDDIDIDPDWLYEDSVAMV